MTWWSNCWPTRQVLMSCDAPLMSSPAPSFVFSPARAAPFAAAATAGQTPAVRLASLSCAKSDLLLFGSKQKRNEGKDDRHRSRQMEGMRHRVPNSGESPEGEICSALLRYAPLSFLTPSPVYFYPPSLSVWLLCFGCNLFCSLLMLSVAILRGSLATRMYSVYTLSSSAASHQHCHGWVGVCVWLRGGVWGGIAGGRGWLCGKERARETSMAPVHIHETILLSTWRQKLSKHPTWENSAKIPLLGTHCLSHKVNCHLKRRYEERGARSGNLPFWWQPF